MVVRIISMKIPLRFAVVVAVLLSLNSLPAVDAVWRADSGIYPDQMGTNWQASIGGGVVTRRGDSPAFK